MIGYFHPAIIGDFRPALTPEYEKLFVDVQSYWLDDIIDYIIKYIKYCG